MSSKSPPVMFDSIISALCEADNSLGIVPPNPASNDCINCCVPKMYGNGLVLYISFM